MVKVSQPPPPPPVVTVTFVVMGRLRLSEFAEKLMFGMFPREIRFERCELPRQMARSLVGLKNFALVKVVQTVVFVRFPERTISLSPGLLGNPGLIPVMLSQTMVITLVISKTEVTREVLERRATLIVRCSTS